VQVHDVIFVPDTVHPSTSEHDPSKPLSYLRTCAQEEVALPASAIAGEAVEDEEETEDEDGTAGPAPIMVCVRQVPEGQAKLPSLFARNGTTGEGRDLRCSSR